MIFFLNAIRWWSSWSLSTNLTQRNVVSQQVLIRVSWHPRFFWISSYSDVTWLTQRLLDHQIVPDNSMWNVNTSKCRAKLCLQQDCSSDLTSSDWKKITSMWIRNCSIQFIGDLRFLLTTRDLHSKCKAFYEDARLRPIRLRTIRLRPAGRNRIRRSRNWPKSKLVGVDRAPFCTSHYVRNVVNWHTSLIAFDLSKKHSNISCCVPHAFLHFELTLVVLDIFVKIQTYVTYRLCDPFKQ